MKRLLTLSVLMVLLGAQGVVAFPGADQACALKPPASAQKPVTGVFWVYPISNDKMDEQCKATPGSPIFGCTFLSVPATAEHPATAVVIFINADLDAAERACTLLYEKAHLPPNNWQDPVVEAAMR